MSRSKLFLMNAAGLIVIVSLAIVSIFVLPKIESFYDYIGDKVPFLKGVFDWAKRVTGY